MKKIDQEVCRVPNCYVGEDCIQIMVPYENSVAIFSKDGIMYSHK